MVVRLTTPETAGAKSGGAESVAFDDPVVANQLFGPRNAHLELLAAGQWRAHHQPGGHLIVDAPDPQVRETLCNVFVQLYDLLRGGVPLSQQDMARAYEMLRGDPGLNLGQIFRDAVFVNTPRKTVTARNVAQRTYLDLLRRYELVFAVGPAGTGKTYLAVAMALSMLQQHRVKRIVLTRPAVEAGGTPGLSARRSGGESQPLSAPSVRCAARHDAPAQGSLHDGSGFHRSGSAGLYAGAHPQRRLHHSG